MQGMMHLGGRHLGAKNMRHNWARTMMRFT